ncbi:HAD-IIIC family phosphatase, partial [Plantactinospora sp. S1510]
MQKIKCVIWDLDDTVWNGVVIEGDPATPLPVVVETIRTLDQRGILHAVASRGDRDLSLAHLTAHGLAEYFCAVEIGWGAKSEAVARIAELLNIGPDTMAFVDNDDMELAEVAAAHPEVRCYRSDGVAELPDRPEFRPAFVTDESAARRRMYQADGTRSAAQERYSGTPAEFLASLDLVMTIDHATGDDLARAHELTVRTHQLNTTGVTFDEHELRALVDSPRDEVLVARLRDRFGDYGTIGLSVTRLRGADAVLHLLLMSCRVMSRGAGAVLLHHVMRSAVDRGLRPLARFVATGKNRVMLVTLRFAGFEPIEDDDGRLLLA